MYSAYFKWNKYQFSIPLKKGLSYQSISLYIIILDLSIHQFPVHKSILIEILQFWKKKENSSQYHTLYCYTITKTILA